MIDTDKLKRFVDAYCCSNCSDCIGCDCNECKTDFRHDLEEVINEQLEFDRMEY